ncbi:MAG: hypothetical protein OXR73_06530 [Myxococcales bacterium]|nr:hypothetical protein [Myxococcales bacterium]
MSQQACEEFWQSIPSRVAEARDLWQQGSTSTRARVAFEDLLFDLKRETIVLGLTDARDVIVALEAFAISVPLSATASRAAEPGIDAGLDMLLAMVHPNVAIHFTALFRLLVHLTSQIAGEERPAGSYRPVFVHPRAKGRADVRPRVD